MVVVGKARVLIWDDLLSLKVEGLEKRPLSRFATGLPAERINA